MNEPGSFVTLAERMTTLFGPVGALALALMLGMGWLYRRDVLRGLEEARADARQSETTVKQLLDLVERNARASEGLMASVDRLGRTLQELEHQHATVLQTVMLRHYRHEEGREEG